jgi:hypothetical protein
MAQFLSVLPNPMRKRWPHAILLLMFPILAMQPAYGQPTDSGSPAVCRIGMNIEALYDLDMARDTFGAILWLWSVCPSAELMPLGTIAFPTASAGLSLGPVEVVAVSSGGQYASRRVQGTFRFNWEMDRYPFDRQRVVIHVDEIQYDADRLVFEPESPTEN